MCVYAHGTAGTTLGPIQTLGGPTQWGIATIDPPNYGVH